MVIGVAAGAHESSLDHEELRTEAEVERVAGFLQLVHDWSELWDDLEPGERIRTTFQIDWEVKALAAVGWLVFGARARGTLRGGQLHGDSNLETAYLRLVRADSPSIISLDPVGSTPHENSTEPTELGSDRPA